MSTHPQRKDREFLCEICGKHGPASSFRREGICNTCYDRASSTQCVRCGKMKRFVSEMTGLCPRCTGRPEGICARCSSVCIIYNQEAWLCLKCERRRRLLLRTKERQQEKVICSVCGNFCTSHFVNRAICESCFRTEYYGRAICAQCHQFKRIQVKSVHLCHTCAMDRQAPARLRKYIEAFTAPNPFTTMLFHLLASTIDWPKVTYKVEHRLRSFGAFLQAHPFHEPLTWQIIEDTCAMLGPIHQEKSKRIRQDLHKVGYLLAAKGQMESRETYIATRRAFRPLKEIPAHLQELAENYADWLWERKLRPETVRNRLEHLASFWTWCAQREIGSPEQVSGDLVTEYLLSLYWKWRCSRCQGSMAFEPSNRRTPRSCVHCGAIGSLIQTSWYAQVTVANHRSTLHKFFDWAKVNHLVVANPVQRRIPMPPQTIRHYPVEITKQLGSLSDPSIDPTEGLILYLIIVHACSVWELQHAQIPSVLPLTEAVPVPSLAKFYYVVIPKAAPSRGRHSPGRPHSRLDFPPEAASWLGPLLERFEQQRQGIVKETSNPYLFVAPGRAHHNTPVSQAFILNLVKRASLHLLGAACTARLLRQTAAVMLADTISAGILPWLGWDEVQAFAYAWAPREIVFPQTTDDSTQTIGPAAFPSAQEWKQTSSPHQSEQRGE